MKLFSCSKIEKLCDKIMVLLYTGVRFHEIKAILSGNSIVDFF